MTRLAMLLRSAFLILTLICVSQTMASSQKYKVTIKVKEQKLLDVFKTIEKQTKLIVFYSNTILNDQEKVSIQVKDEPLEKVLDQIIAGKALKYEVQEKYIVIAPKEKKQQPDPITQGLNPGLSASSPSPNPDVTIVVLSGDGQGQVLVGASVVIKGQNKGIVTDVNGRAVLRSVDPNSIVIISFTGYATQEVKLSARGITPTAATGYVVIHLSEATNELDEVQIGAYSKTSKRLQIGNVSTVKASEIEKSPVSNPLLALQGRVPGLFITQSTGMPGGGVTVRIQGQNSLSAGNDPLYVIDGIPYTSQLLPNLSGGVGILGSGGGSPLSFINPADIESIDILKDADATSIYGSRAAAGAILITTKKGKAGKTKVDVNVQSGWGKVTRYLDLMNTQQYLEMRHEAKANDGAAILPSDYDINGTWDTTRYTNWQKELLGGTARYNNAQVSVSGGNANTTFSIGLGYQKETTVFPGDLSDQKGSLRFHIGNTSNNQKFKVQLSGSYLVDNNRLISTDLAGAAMRLAPNAPALYNVDGSLNWAPLPNGNSTWLNPLSYLNQKYAIKTNNLISNLLISYHLLPGLEIQSSFGYTNLHTNENMIFPTTTRAPERRASLKGESRFANGTISSWIVEPGINYTGNIGKGKLELFAGATLQQNNSASQRLTGRDYSSDLLLADIRAAGSVQVSGTNNSVYRYNAVYGRLNYNWQNKYILNLTARRDGSSRFGPENLFNNFASVAGAWVFSEESFFKKSFPFISFGKLRASYGTTGNDQIGDYQFMNLYFPTNVPVSYGGGAGLMPNEIPNPYLQWEETKKLQAGIDIGFFNDRILLNANYYHNRSSNQLQQYSLPMFTGRGRVLRNFPATIQNNGWELFLSTTNIQSRDVTWKSSLNITLPKNKLVAYPGIETSTQANYLIVGEPISITKLYQFLGVDPTTGLYLLADENNAPSSGILTQSALNIPVDLAPEYYGGIQNTIRYKGLELNFLFQFTRQTKRNYFFGDMPGWFSSSSTSIGIANQPSWLMDARWQKPGDNASIQKFSTVYPASVADPFFNSAFSSDASYSDITYYRLENLSLSWQLPEKWKQKAQLQNARIYAQGQNLLTLTNYKGQDPETGPGGPLPPLRVLTVGVQLSF